MELFMTGSTWLHLALIVKGVFTESNKVVTEGQTGQWTDLFTEMRECI